jgi:hypothetical protein
MSAGRLDWTGKQHDIDQAGIQAQKVESGSQLLRGNGRDFTARQAARLRQERDDRLALEDEVCARVVAEWKARDDGKEDVVICCCALGQHPENDGQHPVRAIREYRPGSAEKRHPVNNDRSRAIVKQPVTVRRGSNAG